MGKYRARVENLRTPIDVLVNLTRKYTHVPPSVLAKLSTVKTVDDIVKLFDEHGSRHIDDTANEEKFERYILEASFEYELAKIAAPGQDIVNATSRTGFVTDDEIDLFNEIVFPELKRVEKRFSARIDNIMRDYVLSDYTVDSRKKSLKSCETMHRAMHIVMMHEIDKVLNPDDENNGGD